jgi:predicted dehydrogenase
MVTLSNKAGAEGPQPGFIRRKQSNITMNKPLNLAIIGCGAVIEELHLPSLRRLSRQGALRVSMLVDPSPDRMARLHRHFPEAVCIDDIERAFPRPGTDLALVASPPSLHRRHVLTALSFGCDVLCEKPLAISPSDVVEMSRAAERHARILMVGMTRRFFPSLATAASLLQKGMLGEGIQFSCLEGGVYQWPIASDAPFRREAGGGGVLVDKGVHVLDSLLWLFGPMTVTQCQEDALAGGVEGNCRLQLEGKARGTMQLSWDQPIASGLHVRGSLGEMRVDPTEFRWIELRLEGCAWKRVPCGTRWPMSLSQSKPRTSAPRVYEDCIHLQWIQFLRSVTYGEPLPAGPREAHIVARQIESAFAMATPLPQLWLGAGEQSAASRRHWKNSPPAETGAGISGGTPLPHSHLGSSPAAGGGGGDGPRPPLQTNWGSSPLAAEGGGGTAQTNKPLQGPDPTPLSLSAALLPYPGTQSEGREQI